VFQNHSIRLSNSVIPKQLVWGPVRSKLFRTVLRRYFSFSLSSFHLCTVEFSRSYIICDDIITLNVLMFFCFIFQFQFLVQQILNTIHINQSSVRFSMARRVKGSWYQKHFQILDLVQLATWCKKLIYSTCEMDLWGFAWTPNSKPYLYCEALTENQLALREVCLQWEAPYQWLEHIWQRHLLTSNSLPIESVHKHKTYCLEKVRKK
jgi:hypothetical protein